MQNPNNTIPSHVKKIYLIAICGTGMGSLAGMLKARGYEVAGSDAGIYPPMSDELASQDISVFSPFAAENLESFSPDLVIVGNAVTAGNPEAEWLMQSQTHYLSMPQALGELFLGDKEVIVVAGTHGKTTTTAIMSHLLNELGENPGFLIGGVGKNAGRNFQLGQGRYFVIEGDEYDTAFFDKNPKFLKYRPKHVILTSVEFDHADIYANADAVEAAFNRLLEIIPNQGSLHFCDAYERLNAIAKKQMGHVSYFMRRYGKGAEAWQIANYQGAAEGSSFDILANGKPVVSVVSPLTGFYNAENVAACFSVLHHFRFSLEAANRALASFKGVKRRQEVVFENTDFVVIDDFAHHPTAVSVTIEAIRERFSGHHLVAVFEPRSNTARRNIFQNEYVESFMGADQVIIAPVNHPEKVPEGKVLDVPGIVACLRERGKQADAPVTTHDIIELIAGSAKRPAVVLIMSNGGFEGIHARLVERIGGQSS